MKAAEQRHAAVARRRVRIAHCFPKRHFPAIHPRPTATSGHLPVTILREPDLVRGLLTALTASVLVCGVAIPAQAQSALPKAPKAAAKPGPPQAETQAGGGGRRRYRRCRADADRPVRHLGRLYRDPERQEGVLRA